MPVNIGRSLTRYSDCKSWGRVVFTLSDPKRDGVAIEGHEQLQQRLSVTRMATLGVFSLAAPKKVRRSTSYITLSLANGETGFFEVKNTDPMQLRARSSPWLAEHESASRPVGSCRIPPRVGRGLSRRRGSAR